MKQLFYTVDNGDSGSCEYDFVIFEKLKKNPSVLQVWVCDYPFEMQIDTDILPDGTVQSLPDWVDKMMVILALLNYNWSQKNAAKSLGINGRVLNYKVHKYGIRNDNWRKNNLTKNKGGSK